MGFDEEDTGEVVRGPAPIRLKAVSTSADGLVAEPEGARVLVIDDDRRVNAVLARLLVSQGFKVTTASDGEAALVHVREDAPDLVLLDLVLPDIYGLELLAKIKEIVPLTPVVMMTAFGDVDTAVAAIKAGAYDFLTKPFSSDETLVLAVKKAAEHSRLLSRTKHLEQALEIRERSGDILGTSPAMLDVYKTIEAMAHTSSTVLVQGESGTGKELVARAIHRLGSRAAGPFVPVNCSAIPESLIESELFGHVRGAFTGAVALRKGLFETASGGTIFLDEIGELAPQIQVKLLRVLQEGEIKRIGSSHSLIVDVQVIAATNVDMVTAMKTGAFREDLYYRLNVINIVLPPLRERAEDIPLLAYHFLDKYVRRSGRGPKRISSEAMNALNAYSWPGNVRELENAIERAVIMARSEVIAPADLPRSLGDQTEKMPTHRALLDMPYTEAKRLMIERFDRDYADNALARTEGNVSRAAQLSRLDRSNFRRMLKKVRSDKER
ncbi:MAG: sigma-54 dependent transcriptional regulator [Deltaproteobacteria bacterium]|nr:sigma-54 dependent transcriptional regulator [Deltaproteobacteria bacterium]